MTTKPTIKVTDIMKDSDRIQKSKFGHKPVTYVENNDIINAQPVDSQNYINNTSNNTTHSPTSITQHQIKAIQQQQQQLRIPVDKTSRIPHITVETPSSKPRITAGRSSTIQSPNIDRPNTKEENNIKSSKESNNYVLLDDEGQELIRKLGLSDHTLRRAMVESVKKCNMINSIESAESDQL